jgi:magnesium transporter
MTSIDHNNSESNEQAYLLGAGILDSVLSAVENGERGVLIDLLDDLHAADIADMLEQISSNKRAELIALWGDALDGEVIAEMGDSLRAEVVDLLPETVFAGAVRDLETDDVVDLVEDLGDDQTERLLEALEDVDRVAVENSLQYPEDTAGRLMQRELVMAPTHWTVGEAIDNLRRDGDLPDRFYDVVMVDPMMKPVGKIPVSSLISNDRDINLAEIMDEEFRTIPVLQTQEDVAYAFNQYNMVSAPVVDERNRLVGVITMDDAMEVLEEEAEEDIKRLAGVGDESLTDNIFYTMRQRFPWLSVNLITSILASIVIAQFADAIETIVALAVLMPIVASMGGNAGTQTLTVAVRALATKDLTSANAMRVIRREVAVGLLNGIVFAILMGIVGVIWYGSPMLGVVLGLAMIANLLVAGLAGILVPISLEKMNIDPALASGAFVTTVTDVVGFFSFLGLAVLLLL